MLFVSACKEATIIERFEEFVTGHTIGIEVSSGVFKTHYVSDGSRYFIFPETNDELGRLCWSGTWRINEGQLCTRNNGFEVIGDFKGEDSLLQSTALGDETCETIVENGEEFLFASGTKILWRSDVPFICKNGRLVE